MDTTAPFALPDADAVTAGVARSFDALDADDRDEARSRLAAVVDEDEVAPALLTLAAASALSREGARVHLADDEVPEGRTARRRDALVRISDTALQWLDRHDLRDAALAASRGDADPILSLDADRGDEDIARAILAGEVPPGGDAADRLDPVTALRSVTGRDSDLEALLCFLAYRDTLAAPHFHESLDAVLSFDVDPQAVQETHTETAEAFASRLTGSSDEPEPVALVGEGELERQQADLDAAVEALDAAVDAYDEADQPHEEHVVRQLLARTHHVAGDEVGARREFDRAIMGFHQLRDEVGSASCQSVLGRLSIQHGDISEAEGYFRSALSAFESTDDRREAGRCREGLGSAAMRRQDYETAREYFEGAVDDAEAIGDDRLLAGSKLNLGTVAKASGDLETAQWRLESAVETFLSIGARRGAANARTTLSEVARERGGLEAADEYLAKAFADFEAVGDAAGLARAAHARGELAMDRDDLDAAENFLDDAVSSFRSANEPYGEARTVDLLGEVARKRGDYLTARGRFEEAADTLLEIGALRDAIPAVDSLLDVCEETDDPDLGIEYAERARDAADGAGMEDQVEHFQARIDSLQG